jgi:hypothetical protein
VALFDSKVRISNVDNLKVFKVEDDFINVIMAWKKENMNPGIPLFTNCVLGEIEL